MATQKGGGGPKGKSSMDWSSPVRSRMDGLSDGANKDEPHIPWTLLVVLLVVSLLFVIVMPVLGVMYMDLNTALEVAKAQNVRLQAEIERARELQVRILREIQERGE